MNEMQATVCVVIILKTTQKLSALSKTEIRLKLRCGTTTKLKLVCANLLLACNSIYAECTICYRPSICLFMGGSAKNG